MQSILKTTNSDHTLICHDSSRCQNIYSPRGSLVRFQRKKLLILDLNGLLADINQDYHNAHLAHALLSFGVFIAATSVTRLLPKPLAACPHGHFFFHRRPLVNQFSLSIAICEAQPISHSPPHFLCISDSPCIL